MTELSLPSTMRTFFPNPDDLLNFTLTIEPDEGTLIGLNPVINGKACIKEDRSISHSPLEANILTSLPKSAALRGYF